MMTLVLNAPRAKVLEENSRSFRATVNSGVGEGYAISQNLLSHIAPGCKVVLLSKDEELRAEGELVELVPTAKTASGMQRYDIHMRHLTQVKYKPEKLNRNGVALI